MTRHLITCLTIIALSFVSPTPASATVSAFSSAVYDTVDAIETAPSGGSFSGITITGIISGQNAPSELFYQMFASSSSNSDAPARCDRLALLAMAKPGKFQLAMNNLGNGTFTCKLIVRTP